MQRVAMLSVHTSPLAQPGAGDGGGMNVYVHALATALARAGVPVDVLTRAEHADQPQCVEVEPGFRVLHVTAGPRAPVPLRELPDLVGEFTDAARDVLAHSGDHDVLHANYWVSGAVGHRLKHELDLPLVTTFHTLERVKAEVGLGDAIPLRPRVEAEVVRCADLVVASTREEHDQLVRHYGADPERIEIITPGVDHTVFAPGDRGAARRARRPRRRTGAAVRRAHPAAQGRRPRGARARRGARPDRAARRRRRPQRSRWRRRGAGAPRARRRARARAPGALRRAAAARRARRLLPRRRRVRGALAHRVVRSRGARGGRVRHTRGRRQRRRSPAPRRRRRAPDSSSTTAIPPAYATRDRPGAGRRVRRAGRARVRAVHAVSLEHRRGAAPPSLRRPHGARATVKCR